jgi:hypothetical protein
MTSSLQGSCECSAFAVNVTIYDDRNCGFGGKGARDGCADSFGASGDENDFVFEFEVHKSRHTYEKIALINAISSVFAVYVPCEPLD